MGVTVNIQTVEVHIHQADTLAIAAVLADIQGKVGIIMGTTAEALVVIGQIRTDTDQLAETLAALANRPDVTGEVEAALNEAAAHLRGIASAFDAAPVDPGVIPGSEPLPA